MENASNDVKGIHKVRDFDASNPRSILKKFLNQIDLPIISNEENEILRKPLTINELETQLKTRKMARALVMTD